MHTTSARDTSPAGRTSFDRLLLSEDAEAGNEGDGEEEVTPYVLGVAVCASISGLMFGESCFRVLVCKTVGSEDKKGKTGGRRRTTAGRKKRSGCLWRPKLQE
jgi:hypothetical protein